MQRTRTLEHFALISFFSAISIFPVFVALRIAYDNTAFGLHPDVGGAFLSTFLPMVGATLVGYRDFLMRGYLAFGNRPPMRTAVHHGWRFIVFLTVLGPVCGIIAMLLLAFNIVYVDAVDWYAGGAATVWGFSTAYLLRAVDKPQQ